MNSMNSGRPKDWASQNIHPGWWFIDVFRSLNPDEKTAWLGLLTLAVSSFPSGRIAYYSDDELSRILNVDELPFTHVLRKAQGLCLVEILNKAIKPEILDYYSGDFDYKDLADSDGFVRYVAVRYKEIVFPGVYSYFPDGTASASDRGLITRGPRTRTEKELLDSEIREPFDLLQRRIREGLKGGLSELRTSDSHRPPEPTRCQALPMDTRLVSDERYADAIISHYPGLALWNRSDLEVLRILENAQVALEIWMRETLSQKDEKGFRLDPRY